ncbi:MAG: MoxR family ATPase [Desulfurococcales archaeon]|nr:MoxR family ATPase [Desulfurococcales archaeon]
MESNADPILGKVREIYGPIVEEGSRRPVRRPEEAARLLESEYGLIVEERIVALTYAAFMNGRPVLFEGPPGTGKTEIGEAILHLWSGRRPFILPCSENYDEYKVIGDFHPAMAMKYGFNEESFIPRPLLAALLLDTGVLVDEIRRSNEEFQNMLLDVSDKRRIIVPELKRVFKARGPGFQMVFTSNPEDIAQNELSDAFLRRVVRVTFSYPSRDVEARIIELRSGDGPGLGGEAKSLILEAVNRLRKAGITHKPGTAESVLWARMAKSLARLRGHSHVTLEDVVDAAFSVLVKRDEDEEIVRQVISELA